MDAAVLKADVPATAQPLGTNTIRRKVDDLSVVGDQASVDPGGEKLIDSAFITRSERTWKSTNFRGKL